MYRYKMNLSEFNFKENCFGYALNYLEQHLTLKLLVLLIRPGMTCITLVQQKCYGYT